MSLEHKYASFQGIRYAQAPINELRFKAPEPYLDKEGVYDVSMESSIMCPQMNMFYGELRGQEDCLFINIYVPENVIINLEKKLPVMVWIHGGGFTGGSNNFKLYGPQHFVEKDIVMVAINYRLGPLGFFSMGNEEVPGNAGMRDQALALSWIRDHIVNFGGDPNSVTIFGESAGGVSVALHLISPLSHGLFNRAIIQSGSALNTGWGPITQKHALQYANVTKCKIH